MPWSVCLSVWIEPFLVATFQCTDQLRELQAKFDAFKSNSEVAACNMLFHILDCIVIFGVSDPSTAESLQRAKLKNRGR